MKAITISTTKLKVIGKIPITLKMRHWWNRLKTNKNTGENQACLRIFKISIKSANQKSVWRRCQRDVEERSDWRNVNERLEVRRREVREMWRTGAKDEKDGYWYEGQLERCKGQVRDVWVRLDNKNWLERYEVHDKVLRRKGYRVIKERLKRYEG